MKKNLISRVVIGVLITLGILIALSCSEEKQRRGRGTEGASDQVSAALATYVAPGDLDEYYLFYSGGHGGQIFVAGVPSMRHICTIPVFTPYPGTGYGYDDESRAMLGGYSWGDSHHPALSETAGEYDGRWLFINDNAKVLMLMSPIMRQSIRVCWPELKLIKIAERCQLAGK
jgi:nitrous-oxide reductase